jgi:hypothetical protein
MASELVKTQSENKKIYIQMTKTNIDTFICNNEYKKAFALLIMVLERLDNDEKVEFIDYYSKKLYDSKLFGGMSHLHDRRFDCKSAVEM